MADQKLSTSIGSSRREQEVAPGEFAPEMYVRDVWSAGIANGRAFIVGSGHLTLSLAGSVRGLISNPVGSTVGLTVVGMTAFATAVGWAQLILNPTTGLPALTRPGLALNPAPQVRQSQVGADTNTTTALGGGTDTGVIIGLPGGSRIQVSPIGLVLAPGMSLGLQIPFTGSADAEFALYLVEE